MAWFPVLELHPYQTHRSSGTGDPKPLVLLDPGFEGFLTCHPVQTGFPWGANRVPRCLIYIVCVCMKLMRKSVSVYIHAYIYICILVCVCVCLCSSRTPGLVPLSVVRNPAQQVLQLQEYQPIHPSHSRVSMPVAPIYHRVGGSGDGPLQVLHVPKCNLLVLNSVTSTPHLLINMCLGRACLSSCFLPGHARYMAMYMAGHLKWPCTRQAVASWLGCP